MSDETVQASEPVETETVAPTPVTLEPQIDDSGRTYATGKRKEYTPEWTASLSADWRQPLGDAMELRAGVDMNYTDSYLYAANLDPRTDQDAYAVWNARIALASASDTWEIAILGRNLTDEEVINFGGNVPLGKTLTQGNGNSYYAFVNRPRNIAVQLSYNF